jgi:hypothetical protein
MNPKQVQEAEINAEVSAKTNEAATGRKEGEMTRNTQWSRIFSPTVKSACSQMKLGQELLQENITTRDPNGTKNASAALVGSSRSTVSPTAKTQRVTWKQKKVPPSILQQMLLWIKVCRKN